MSLEPALLTSGPTRPQLNEVRTCCGRSSGRRGFCQVEGGLLRDEDWRPFDGEMCRATAFTPLAGRVEGSDVKSSSKGLPYASIEIEAPSLAEPANAFITHKDDFPHLWHV